MAVNHNRLNESISEWGGRCVLVQSILPLSHMHLLLNSNLFMTLQHNSTHTFCFQTNFNQLLQIIIYMHSTPFSFHSILIYYLLDNVDKFIGSIAHCLACLEVYMAELGYLGFDKVLTITKQHQQHQQPYHWSGELLCMQTHVKRSFSTTIQTISTQHSVLQASAQQPSSHKIR